MGRLSGFLIPLLALGVFLTLSSLPCRVQGCSVPVFRYALERWRPDVYGLAVFHHGEQTGQALAAIEKLQTIERDYETPTNYSMRVVDLDDSPRPEMLELWKTQKDAETPRIVLIFPPGGAARGVAWSGPLKAFDEVTSSPARAEIARRIIDEGESAVWLYVESGDQARDEKLVNFLETQLEQLEDELVLPTILPEDRYVLGDQMSSESLELDFSVLRISREDPKERFLLSLLLKSEPDLEEMNDEPIVFPVYGRGRTLYALVGEGINERNVYETAQFLAGECSCEIKGWNPGIDLLVQADWTRAIASPMAATAESRYLAGISQPLDKTTHSLDAPTTQTTEQAASDSTNEVGEQGFPVILSLVGSLGAMVVVIAVVAGIIWSRRKRVM